MLSVKRTANDDVVELAKIARAAARADAVKASKEIAALQSLQLAAIAAQLIPDADADAAAEVAVADARRRRVAALEAEGIATTTIRLHDTYHAHLIHDIERTRDEIKRRRTD